MVGVARAKQSPASRTALHEHAVAARARRTVSNTMLNYVYVDAGPKRLFAGFSGRTVLDLPNFEVGSFGMFAMQQSCRQPYFVRNLDLSFCCDCHFASPIARN